MRPAFVRSIRLCGAFSVRVKTVRLTFIRSMKPCCAFSVIENQCVQRLSVPPTKGLRSRLRLLLARWGIGWGMGWVGGALKGGD